MLMSAPLIVCGGNGLFRDALPLVVEVHVLRTEKSPGLQSMVAKSASVRRVHQSLAELTHVLLWIVNGVVGVLVLAVLFVVVEHRREVGQSVCRLSMAAASAVGEILTLSLATNRHARVARLKCGWVIGLSNRGGPNGNLMVLDQEDPHP